MDHTTTYDDAHVEQQVYPDKGDNMDHGDASQDIPQPDLEDIPQPEAPTLLVLKEKEVYTIGMFRHIYIVMYVFKNVIGVQIYLYSQYNEPFIVY